MSDTNDKTKDLNEKRKEHRLLERAQLNFFIKHEKEKQKEFAQMSATESMLDFQYQTDYTMLFELFLNWLKKAKNDEQKKIINTSLKALMRMQSYCDTLQTVSKRATIDLNDERHITSRMVIKVSELEKQITTLKREIEYYDQDK